MIKSNKIIPVYKNGKGIYEVIIELEKGARELSKYTLDINTVPNYLIKKYIGFKC